jgi:DNA-binding transcriptional MerR regulator
MTTALVRTRLLDLDAFSRAAGIHPDLARRLVTLGIIEATRDAHGALRFEREQIAVAARVQRLRAGFALNYAAVALVAELLDRITDLEREMRVGSRSTGG